MEYENNGLKIHEMPTRKDGTTRTMIEKLAMGGVPQVWVHPFFNEDMQALNTRKGYIRYCEVRNDAFADSIRKGKTPLILEQVADFHRLHERLRPFGPGEIYAWVTPHANPTPVDFRIKQKLFKRGIINKIRAFFRALGSDIAAPCWDSFANLFHQEGIRRLSVGGQWLVYKDPAGEKVVSQLKQPESGLLKINGEVNTELIPGYCVGVFATQMVIRGIDIDISLPGWPDDHMSNRHLYFD